MRLSRVLRIAPWLIAISWPYPVVAGVEARPSGWDWISGDAGQAWAITGLYGRASANNLSGTLEDLPGFDETDDEIALGAVQRRLVQYRDLFAIEGEALYAYHFGEQVYHEAGVAAYIRWLAFPWNGEVVTTAALGIGPSWISIYPDLEEQPNSDDQSKILNQFNLELTVGLESLPSTVLVLRIQHRSGVFGAFGGVWDGSNFMTAGLRQFF